VTSIGVGAFEVNFAKLSAIATAAAAQGTPFNAADSCVVNITRPAGHDLQDIVQCTRVATAIPTATPSSTWS
jgi:hypothetical protein